VTPAEQHTAALAALAELEEMNLLAADGPWQVREAKFDDGSGIRSWDVETDLGYFEIGSASWDEWSARLVVAHRNSATVVLAGRRRILERHAPSTVLLPHLIDRAGTTAPACSGCDDTWMCADYRDAAAGLLPGAQP
jgi:hypothetical protein